MKRKLSTPEKLTIEKLTIEKLTIEKLYTITEACKILAIHRNSMYTYIKTGRVKAIRIFKNYRISEDELNRLKK